MTDPTDRDGDLLRAALRADVEGVVASDDLLVRIHADASAPQAARRPRRVPALLAAAAVLAVVALATALLTGGDETDEGLDVVDGPEPTAPADPTPPDMTDADDPVVVPGEQLVPGPRPGVLVGVTDDGRLVVVDVDSGEELRELWALDDPAGPADLETGIGPWHISGVALHPDGTEVFVEVCCEPAGGNIYVVAMDGSGDPGSQPSHVGYGMDVSGDGRWLASMSSNLLILSDLDDPGQVRSFDLGEEGFHYRRVAVNEDGTEVTVEHVLERDDASRPLRSEGVVFRIEGDDITEIDRFRGEGDRRAYAIYGQSGWPNTRGTTEASTSIRGDASGVWHLEVTDLGGVSWMSNPAPPGQDWEAPPGDASGQVPTHLRFIDADW